MNSQGSTVLVADDDTYVRDDLRELLSDSGHRLLFTATAKETFEVAEREQPDLVLLDIKFPDCADLSLLQRIKQHIPAAEVIILTSQSDKIAQVVAAVKLGAFDYVPKPFNAVELLNRIDKALRLRVLSKSQEYFLSELNERSGLERLVGSSTPMRQLREMILKLADADGNILIEGESGTGKELVARALHLNSRRNSAPFVAINCAAIPEALVESVLFGHRRGAFTGAVESSRGKFEIAEEGTLFLDEIGDMPMAQQASLLRVLEGRSYTAVGDNQEKICRARFVFSTNCDLRARIRDSLFREDLYYRITVGVLRLPALRNRIEDIPELVGYQVRSLCAEMGREPLAVPADVLELLKRYDWPGNVRELRNILEGSIMLLAPDKKQLALADLPAELLATFTGAADAGEKHDLRDKEALVRALKQCRGNQTQAAKLLGLHRNTVRARVRYYGITHLDLH